MKRIRAQLSLLIVGLLAVGLLSCATRPKPSPGAEAQDREAGGAQVQPPDPSSIKAEATGLAPAGDARYQRLTFALAFGNPEAVRSWSLGITSEREVIKTIRGDASNLPESLFWDGRNDAGALAPEGSYTAVLDIDYGGAFKSSRVAAGPFLLDISPPEPSFSPNPALFPYATKGIARPVTVSIAAKSGLAPIAGWTIDIYDTVGGLVKSLSGDWPAAQAAWDGRTSRGNMIEASDSFPAILRVRDIYGNTGSCRGSFAVADIPSPEGSAITTRRAGFSPTSTSVKNSLDLLLAVGSRPNVQTWLVQVMSAKSGPIKSFKGGLAELPEYLRWDGRDESGQLAPEGSYYAVLAINYGRTLMPALVRSLPFSLVTTAPKGSITVDPPTAELASLGPRNPINLTVQARSAFAKIMSWTMGVYDERGKALAEFKANWPNNKVAWDGRGSAGARLLPGVEYAVVARVADEYGNVGELKGNLETEGLAAPTEPSLVRALSPGFAPTGDGTAPTMELALEIGNLAAVESWKLDIVGSGGETVRSFGGGAASAVTRLSWDGRTAGGGYAGEGVYRARLGVDYGNNYSANEAMSGDFVLDLTPPAGRIALSTQLFSPDGDGLDDTVTISIEASSRYARIASWSMAIVDPGQNLFYEQGGDWPAGAIVWNGRGARDELVESAEVYPITVRLRDEFGNIGELKKDLDTDIIVVKVGDGYRVRVSSIYFKAFTADYRNVPPDRAEQNLKTLDLLAAKLARFPGYGIRLEGHAVMINWDDRAKGEAEQAAILLPLSESRARAIKEALVERHLEADRLQAIGLGARDPVVPDSDYSNRWKNRRVEFFILK